MTIDSIINLLKKDGINSKKLVIDMLENATKQELCELARSCHEKISLMEYNNGNFTEREKQVYELRFIKNLTLEQTGKELGVTRERVRQIEAKILRKLRVINDTNNMLV